MGDGAGGPTTIITASTAGTSTARGFVGPRFHVGPRVYPHYSPYYHGGYYYGYVPPVVVAPPPPTSYIERFPASQYWHYCQTPAGYYPDVQQCPGGWIQVPPRTE